MGKGDNRRTLKTKQRAGQAKVKNKIKKNKEASKKEVTKKETVKKK